MQEEEDILDDVIDEDQQPRNEMYIAAAVSATLQNLISITFFLYEYNMPGVRLSTMAGMVTLLTQLLFSRGLLLFALAMFWRKRKSGWMLSVICYLAGICKMSSTVELILKGGALGLENNPLPWAGFLCVFVLSVLTLVLCLTGSVRQFFSVTLKQMVWTLAASIGFLFVTTSLEQIINTY